MQPILFPEEDVFHLPFTPNLHLKININSENVGYQDVSICLKSTLNNSKTVTYEISYVIPPKSVVFEVRSTAPFEQWLCNTKVS